MKEENNSLVHIEIEGNSMFPTIKDGESVVAREIDYRQAEIGDILAYESPQNGRLIVHRLVKKVIRQGRVSFIAQGDANASYCNDVAFDPWQAQIKKVVAVVKEGVILDMDKGFSKWSGYFKALTLWYVPFLILPLRKIKKAIMYPAKIPHELAKNMSSVIARFKMKILFFCLIVFFSLTQPPIGFSLNNSEDIDSLIKLADEYSAQKRYSEAIETIKKVIKLEPNSFIGHSYLGWIYHRLGAFNLSFQEYSEIIPASEFTIKVRDSDFEKKEILAQALYDFAILLKKMGKKEEAVAEFLRLKRLIEQNPNLESLFSQSIISTIDKAIEQIRSQGVD